jgi:hypothetical protein
MIDTDWRLRKLRRLVDAQGGPAAFARAWSRNHEFSSIDPTYVSQLLNGHRAFGDRARLNMARRCALPDDFFEVPDEYNTGGLNSQRAIAVEESPCPLPYQQTPATVAEVLALLQQLPEKARMESLGAVRVIAAAYGVRSRVTKERTG